MFKINKSNDILSEITVIFSNAISKGDDSVLEKLIKYEPLRIFCEGIRSSKIEEIILNSMKGIYLVLRNFYKISKKDLESFEIELDSVIAIINNLIFSKNDVIANQAKGIRDKFSEYKRLKKIAIANTDFLDKDSLMRMDY